MSTAHYEFVQLLKTKGTGATMGKHLSLDQLDTLTRLFLDSGVHLTTKATLLTAILTLEKTVDEQHWLDAVLRSPEGYLPLELVTLVPGYTGDFDPFLTLIHRVISGQDLTDDQARQAMAYVCDPMVEEYLKAAFLEAERLKRETLVENQAFLSVLMSRSLHRRVDLPFLIDLSASYDGYNRTYFLLPFTAAVLASMGFPSILHGIDEISPKNGMNTSKLLQAAGKNPLLSFESVISDLQNPAVGWSYIDESVFSPTLFQLKTLRFNMVKRPFLATLEKLLAPIRGTKTALMTSYTHPPYRGVLTSLIQQQGVWDRALIVRGAEGGIQLNLDRRTPWVKIQDTTVEDGYISPTLFGFGESEPPVLDNALDAAAVCAAGIAALSGQRNPVYAIIEYQVLCIVHLLGLIADNNDAQLRVVTSIQSGDALRRWTAGASA